jgi:cytochrome c5
MLCKAITDRITVLALIMGVQSLAYAQGSGTSASTQRLGPAVFNRTCAACHEGGISGAPALRDKAAWEVRLEKGPEALIQSALNGVRGMPARGGNASLTDSEVRAAVTFMIRRVRKL